MESQPGADGSVGVGGARPRAAAPITSQASRVSQLSAKFRAAHVSLPVRIGIAILGVIGCILLSSTRYNLSIAIVSMVHDSCTPSTSICAQYHLENAAPLSEFGVDNNTSNSSNSWSNLTHHALHHRKMYEINAMDSCGLEVDRGRKLNWSEAEQGLALGAYYYGFATTHIFGGRLAERSRIGPKWIIATGLVGAAIFNAALPVTARLSYVVFVVIRAIIGAFHGVVHPSLYFLFQNWFPKKEQSTALAMLLLGTSLGLILNVPIAGAISDIQVFGDYYGWPLLFYGGSALHLFWLIFWTIFVTDKPEEHKLIKDVEIGYIRQNSHNILETNLDKAPWKAILKSRALYASIIAKISWSFNHAVIIDNGPSYLNKIAGFDMFRASVHIALVYLFTSAIFMAAGPMFTFFKQCLPFSLTRSRKIFQNIVFLGAAITMFILPSVGCNENSIILLIVINMLTQGFVAGGEYPLLNEYSGNYSGTVYGIAITFDSLARFLAPIIRGELVKTADTLPNWNIIFYITAGLNVLGLIVFECYATATPQEWALKKDMIPRQVSDDGKVTKVPLDKPAKKELKRELENPNFRLDINTEEEDWKEFKEATIVA